MRAFDDDPEHLFVPSGEPLTDEQAAELPVLTNAEIEAALEQGQRDRRAAELPGALCIGGSPRFI